MIFGDCPYCDEPLTIGLPEGIKLPVLAKIECEHCYKEFFERLSRIDPQAYTLEEVEVDEDTKRVIKIKEL
jgi:hypothetical protein